jgi:hypothetical protein
VTRTEAERLTRIETLLEADVTMRASERAMMLEKFEDMARDVKTIKDDMAAVKAEVSADKADLAALKNKGAGLLVGAAIAGGAGWEAIKALIGSVVK